MSEVVAYKGVVTLVAESLKEFMHSKGLEIEDESKLYDLFYNEGFDSSYVYNIDNDEVYKIKELVDIDSEGIYEATKLPNNDIKFLVSYYNGGESLEGAISESIKKVNKE